MTERPILPEGIEHPTPEAIAEFQAWAVANDLAMAEQERLQAEREALLAAPLTPLPFSGSTVAEVKASAETVIADLATQMQAKIDAILGNS